MDDYDSKYNQKIYLRAQHFYYQNTFSRNFYKKKKG